MRKRLERWITAFLNDNTGTAKFLCEVGIFHSFVNREEGTFCRFCRKPYSEWDSFVGFNG